MPTRFQRTLILVMLLALLGLACNLSGKTGAPTVAPTQPLSPTDPSAPTDPPAPTDTPLPPTPTKPAEAAVELGEEQRSEAGGFSFRPVSGYEVTPLGEFVTMQPPGADEDTGPVMVLSGASALEEATLESLLADLTTELKISDSEFQQTTVGNQPALAVDFTTTENDILIAGRVVVVKPAPGWQFTILAGGPQERWEQEVRPAFEAVLASISFFEPVAAEPTVIFEQFDLIEVRQWAIEATASSEYTDSGWNALQATGAPDTLECGDYNTAWASESSSGVEWLELRFLNPVRASQINIVQTYNPSQVVKVELIDIEGSYHAIYSATPEVTADCPFTLNVNFDQTEYDTVGVKITIDQSTVGMWNEIDAVELVGMGLATALEVPVETPVTEPPLDTTPLAGFAWRAGGLSGYEDGQFSTVGGLDVGADDRLYAADGGHGVYVYDLEGNYVSLITHDDLFNPSEVEVGPDGNIYVPAWGSSEVFVFSPQGELLIQFGEEGTGDGQFGSFSPEALAVAENGQIFVLDENEDAAGNSYDRIQVFSSQGKFLRAFKLADDNYAPSALEFGPDGNLYLVGFIGGYIMKLTPDGQLLAEIGKEVLDFSGPQKLAIDQAGNFYVSTWTPAGVVVLDPQGEQIAQWGTEIDNGDEAWFEGGFYQPSGVAVLADGSRIFAADWSGSFAYITAFSIK